MINSHLENQFPGSSKGKAPNIFRNYSGTCWPAAAEQLIAVISVHMKEKQETHFYAICRNALSRGNCGLMHWTQNQRSWFSSQPCNPVLCSLWHLKVHLKYFQGMMWRSKNLQCSWRDSAEMLWSVLCRLLINFRAQMGKFQLTTAGSSSRPGFFSVKWTRSICTTI